MDSEYLKLVLRLAILGALDGLPEDDHEEAPFPAQRKLLVEPVHVDS